MPHYYWDSCVFLAYISNEPSRANVIETMLEECRKGSIQISTSMLTVGEVAYASYEKAKQSIDVDAEAKIDSLWKPATRIQLLEVTELVIREARALLRTGLSEGLMPKLPDAIHLASAKRVGVDEVHTYDKLQKYADLAHVIIKEPALIQPQLPYAAPMDQSQVDVVAEPEPVVEKVAVDAKTEENKGEPARSPGGAIEDRPRAGTSGEQSNPRNAPEADA
jgi:predicted nucleic acid-binding protein